MVQKLRYNYHDASLAEVELGPRREVTLFLQLSGAFDEGSERLIKLRFGGIENFENVNHFFAQALLARPNNGYIARVDILEYDDSVMSAANKLILKIELDGPGLLQVRCTNVTEQDAA